MKRLLLLAVVILFAATLASAAPFKIALSNSFMGNDWRQEMEKVDAGGCQQAILQEPGDAHDHQLRQFA